MFYIKFLAFNFPETIDVPTFALQWNTSKVVPPLWHCQTVNPETLFVIKLSLIIVVALPTFVSQEDNPWHLTTSFLYCFIPSLTDKTLSYPQIHWPAPSITVGLLVLVQEVMAAMTTEPWRRVYSWPSYTKGTVLSCWSAGNPYPLKPIWKAQEE